MSELLILETALSVTEVERRLTERLVPAVGLADTIFRNAAGASDPKAERSEGIRFSGTVSDGRFDLIRWVPYQNSFRPRLRGTFRSTGKGTAVELRVDSIEVWVRVAVALLIALIVGWFSLAGVEFSFHADLLIPIGVVSGVVLTFLIGPKIEMNKAKRGLAWVVGASRHDG